MEPAWRRARCPPPRAGDYARAFESVPNLGVGQGDECRRVDEVPENVIKHSALVAAHGAAAVPEGRAPARDR
jgi:hypothetical protein